MTVHELFSALSNVSAVFAVFLLLLALAGTKAVVTAYKTAATKHIELETFKQDAINSVGACLSRNGLVGIVENESIEFSKVDYKAEYKFVFKNCKTNKRGVITVTIDLYEESMGNVVRTTSLTHI